MRRSHVLNRPARRGDANRGGTMWKWITEKVLGKTQSVTGVTVGSLNGNSEVTQGLRSIPGRDGVMSCLSCGRFVSSNPERVHNCKKL